MLQLGYVLKNNQSGLRQLQTFRLKKSLGDFRMDWNVNNVIDVCVFINYGAKS